MMAPALLPEKSRCSTKLRFFKVVISVHRPHFGQLELWLAALIITPESQKTSAKSMFKCALWAHFIAKPEENWFLKKGLFI